MKNIIIAVFGIVVGVIIAKVLIFNNYFLSNQSTRILSPLASVFNLKNKQVIGFLPYWLLEKNNRDYSAYLSSVSYFNLSLNPDGTIKKLANEAEEDPGWTALRTGKLDDFYVRSKTKSEASSLVVFTADEETISSLLDDPEAHALNLINDVEPIMRSRKFTDLNLDVESIVLASDEARLRFSTFVKEVKKNLQAKDLGTLTIDASPIVLFKKYLIDLKIVGATADYIVLMTYDYHYPGSSVTGPVAPIGGAGVSSELDTTTAIEEALKILPPEKIILGVPLYGYEWETLADSPRSGVIPSTGLVASVKRISEVIKNCSNCVLKRDPEGDEGFLTYKDKLTGTFHQFFYPDEESIAAKTRLATRYDLHGVALWAMGYEDDKILSPLANYKAE